MKGLLLCWPKKGLLDGISTGGQESSDLGENRAVAETANESLLLSVKGGDISKAELRVLWLRMSSSRISSSSKNF